MSDPQAVSLQDLRVPGLEPRYALLPRSPMVYFPELTETRRQKILDPNVCRGSTETVSQTGPCRR